MAPLNPDAVAQVAREFFSGQSDHAQRIWLLFIYGLWSRLAHQAGH